MDIRQLTCFVKVAEAGSYTAAAKAMFMSQPGLFKAIRTMEQELGVPLFLQKNHKTTPSPAGHAIYAKAKELLSVYDELVSTASTFSKKDVLSINAGVFTTSSDYRFSHAVSRSIEQEPDTAVNVSVFSAWELREKLISGELDVALAVFYENEKQEGLDIIPLAQKCYCCIVHRDHELAQAKNRTIKFHDLAGRLILMPGRATIAASFITDATNLFWKSAQERPRVVFAEDPSLQSTYLRRASAVHLVPFGNDFQVDSDDLVVLRLEDINFPHTVAYAKKRSESVSPQLELLWKILQEEAEIFRRGINENSLFE